MQTYNLTPRKNISLYCVYTWDMDIVPKKPHGKSAATHMTRLKTQCPHSCQDNNK